MGNRNIKLSMSDPKLTPNCARGSLVTRSFSRWGAFLSSTTPGIKLFILTSFSGVVIFLTFSGEEVFDLILLSVFFYGLQGDIKSSLHFLSHESQPLHPRAGNVEAVEGDGSLGEDPEKESGKAGLYPS